MRFGIVTFATDRSISPGDLGRAVEDAGFDSLFMTEHSNIPASRRTPYPGGGSLPDEYLRTYDPFIALTAAAMTTTTLRIGTGMCLVAQRDPIHTAKATASLDQISQGRFQFGVGAGWNREEMEQHNTDPRTRMALLRERVLAIKRLWNDDVACFRGDFVDIEPTTVRPAPFQKPGPPVILGGMGPTVIERVVDYADAWAPNPGWPPMPDLPDRIVQLRESAQAAGRGHIPVYLFGMDAVAEHIDNYAGLGVEECVFLLPTLSLEETLTELKRITSVAEPYR
ncbi:LLM class F420-dependent oxidoreductase [Rhodococcus qingshengii]|uniref:LLM class F420-dependent oxidoreductase n=1 Tax=Rhodococcus qingshengii TaxID=334542 RepID=UPI001E5D18DC|nr:LLM class F420-dependent oxidoreductase [Rhodococcus qingshengii]MCQ4150576.1 LLM class F420-dependent oxidoreductase [Rhodococcus qingshengii]UGQ55436.1 LLM class F420-dependent oxidoreductase [Rhodococcus qingshengii]